MGEAAKADVTTITWADGGGSGVMTARIRDQFGIIGSGAITQSRVRTDGVAWMVVHAGRTDAGGAWECQMSGHSCCAHKAAQEAAEAFAKDVWLDSVETAHVRSAPEPCGTCTTAQRDAGA